MKYYALQKAENSADLYIFGDIVDPFWQGWGSDADVSGFSIVKELATLGDVDEIHVHINSYGGVVSEGLAIHNLLQSHPAKVTTYCDGFACSAASVVFMAGDERYMRPASLLMIHNAWTGAAGNAEELRKVADELETISHTAANAYKGKLTISDAELQTMMDEETWIPPEDALSMGFATGILAATAAQKASANVRQKVYGLIKSHMPHHDERDSAPPPPVPEQTKQKKFFNFKEENR